MSHHQRSLAEQCQPQNFHIRCFKLDFDAVKSKFSQPKNEDNLKNKDNPKMLIT